MNYLPDPDTGYYDDDDPKLLAQEEAHEAAEEARYLEELQATHSPESDPGLENEYLNEFTITPARQPARSIQNTKEAA